MKQSFLKRWIRVLSRKSDNQGASLVVVVVAIAFVSMLVAMCAHMTYYNYAMKHADKISKDNFYSAEESLAEINVGLQGVVSNAMAVAYTAAQQQNTSLSMDSRTIYFQQMYEKELLKALKDPVLGDTYYSVDVLKSYLVKTKYVSGVGTQILTKSTGPSPENLIFSMNGGIVLQNVSLMYTDPGGYVTYITTDISIELPPLSLASTSGVPDLENCSIIANDNLNVIANNNLRISGNVYGGKDGLYVDNDTKMTFDKKDSDSEGISYKLIAGNVTVHNSTTSSAYAMQTTKNYDLWTDDIIVDSGKLALGGSTYVQDDLTVEGKNSSVTLAGDYYGYGDELYKSKQSSSILVNGAGTKLDFSGLNNLLLSGHAYIGARHYNANLTADDYVVDPDAEETTPGAPELYAKNDKDLMMGESIGVKSNQLMYMVPKECMGYYRDSTEQYLAKNPITYSEYLTLTTTMRPDGTRRYDEVNLGIVMNKTGKSVTDSGASYRTVFRKVSGTVLVYYYLEFASEKAANDFFKAYYESDKENVDSYVKSYISSFTLNPNLKEANANLHLAGNAIKFDSAGEVEMLADTATANVTDSDRINDNRVKWQDTYLGYSKKMMPNTSTLSAEQLSRDIFYNLVKPYADVCSVVPANTSKIFESGSTKAIVINNKNASTPTVIDHSMVAGGICLVIATGDLKVRTDFNGLILCGGTLTVEGACNKIESDAVAVRKAMLAKKDDKRVCDLLVDGAAYAAMDTSGAADEEAGLNDEEIAYKRADNNIKVEDLIKYQKWTKR